MTAFVRSARGRRGREAIAPPLNFSLWVNLLPKLQKLESTTYFTITQCQKKHADCEMAKLEFCNVEKSDICSFISSTIRSPLQCCYKLNRFLH